MSYTRIVNYVRLSLVRGVEFDHTHADRASSLYALMHSGTGERAYSREDPLFVSACSDHKFTLLHVREEEIERGEGDRAHDSMAFSAFFRSYEASCIYQTHKS